MAHDVFISYSSQDKPTADAVCATLEGKGVRCWIAPRDVLPSEDYAEALMDAINGSRLVLLVFSSNSNTSPQVKSEVERAAAKGIPILPIRIEDVAPSASMEFFIGRRHWLDALTPPLERHLQQLAETVKLLLTRGETATAAVVDATRLQAAPTTAPPPEVADRTSSQPPGLGPLLADWVQRPAARVAVGIGVVAAILMGTLVVMSSGGDEVQTAALTPTSRDATPVAGGASPAVGAASPTPTRAPTLAGSSAAPVPPSGEYGIALNLECVAPGGQVEVAWTAEQEFADQVRLYEKGAPFGQYELAIYTNLDDERRIVGAPSEAGEYEFRYMRGESHLARSDPFTVESGCPADGPLTLSADYTLSASANCVAPGGEIEVTWAVQSEFADQVRLYEKGSSFGQYELAIYVNSDNESRLIQAPQKSGVFELRYMRGETHLAVSGPVTSGDSC